MTSSFIVSPELTGQPFKTRSTAQILSERHVIVIPAVFLLTFSLQDSVRSQRSSGYFGPGEGEKNN